MYSKQHNSDLCIMGILHIFILYIMVMSTIPCQDWSPEQQARMPSLYISFGSGRLAARMTPYMMMLVFQEKHGLNVMVDKNIKQWIAR